MQPLSAAVLVACALAGALGAQAELVVEAPVFFKDVPGQPRAQADQEVGVEQGLRIYNGGVASRTQFPYQAALFIDLSTFCGGSLIHERWVLTAAHCVQGNIWYVMLGVTESLAPKQEGRQTFITRGGMFHPDYDKKKIINDIGVIQLMRPASTSGAFISTVPLTPAGKKYIGSLGTVAGFGRTDDTNASPVSPVLHYTMLPIIDNQACADKYGDSSLHPSVMCLRAEGSSSCKGDSGGPLTVADATGRQVQVGLVSFGASRGCTLGYPVGYTNVSYFIEWLSETTGIDFHS